MSKLSLSQREELCVAVEQEVLAGRYKGGYKETFPFCYWISTNKGHLRECVTGTGEFIENKVSLDGKKWQDYYGVGFAFVGAMEKMKADLGF